jgi:hypothetical protein
MAEKVFLGKEFAGAVTQNAQNCLGRTHPIETFSPFLATTAFLTLPQLVKGLSL